jgi:hypothetical protein
MDELPATAARLRAKERYERASVRAMDALAARDAADAAERAFYRANLAETRTLAVAA